MLKKVTEYDVVYISYDEPNREENWTQIKLMVPHAQRVDGVKGFDTAHKAAASLATTDRVVTIDGDNELLESFLHETIDTDIVPKDAVISWSCRNHINGLVYGNGGVKLWPVHVINSMKSHEIAETPRLKLDFCWDLDYLQRNQILSVTRNNASPLQAFRAGFREGVKMSLVDGAPIKDPFTFEQNLFHLNLQRLRIWMSIGQDEPNGVWAIYGARLGFCLLNFDDLDSSRINDYDWMFTLFQEMNHVCRTPELLMVELNHQQAQINRCTDLTIDLLGADDSVNFKQSYVNPPRVADERRIL